MDTELCTTQLREMSPTQSEGKQNSTTADRWESTIMNGGFDQYKGCTTVEGNTFSPLSMHI